MPQDLDLPLFNAPVAQAIELSPILSQPPVEDRPYQAKVLEDVRMAIRERKRRVVMVVPTGGGKTVIAAQLVKLAVDKGSKVLFIAHRRELIFQCAEKLERFGIPHGLVMSGTESNGHHPVQVASVATLWHRGVRSKKIPLPEAEILIIDECHRRLANTYLKLIEHYGNGVVLGLTATPVRSDGRGLGNVYHAMVEGPTIQELTVQGYLVPVRYFAPSIPDLKGVKVAGGDYNEGQLEHAMDKPKLVGDIVENWARIAKERQTVVFASGVQHSVHLKNSFVEAGVAAESIDGSTDNEERDAMLRRFADGTTRVICNCMVLTEGWDCPVASCAVLARPTKSVGLYLQMAGRILRPSPGKTDTILIDHSGAVYDHGQLHEMVSWSLDANERIQDRQKAHVKKVRKPITCQKCKAVYSNKPQCPECGHIPIRHGRQVETKDGELLELNGDKGKPLSPDMGAYRRRFYAELLGYCAEKNKKPGFAFFTFQRKFGIKPPCGVEPAPPGPEVRAYIRSRQIAYAKSAKRNRPIGADGQL